MKKNLLSLIAIVSLTLSSAIAQDGIEIRLDGVGADISSGVHSINLYATSPDLVGGVYEVHFDVTNTTGSDQQWKITRKKMSVPATWIDQVCWPPQCYPTSGDVYMTPNTVGNPAPIIVNGTSTTTNAALAELKPRITPDPAAASSALYRYYITSVAGVYLDSIDLSINYVLAVTPLKQTTSLTISPNPADDNVKIALDGIENSSVKIVDVLGNVVYNESINNGTKNIDVSNFKNGVYFVLVEASGIKSFNRKLIIRH